VTGPQHYEAAERWLFKAEHEGARGGSETAESCAAIARAHAVLALAAATALPVGNSWPTLHHAWAEAAGGAA
jgi:hypothetical protein